MLFVFVVQARASDKKESQAISHYIMGVIHEDSGRIEQAIEAYKKVLASDDKNSVVHLSLASSYIKNNQPLKAIEELNIAARLSPDAVEPHAILALLYSSLDKTDLATSEYEIALKNAAQLQPKNADIYKGLGAIYLRQKKLKEAENTFKLITSINPADPEAHFYLGNVYSDLNNGALAEKEILKAIELNPDYHQALNYLAYLYVEENRNLGQAEKMLKKALELEPGNAAYIDSIGWLYFKEGKYKEAVKELERASALLDDPVIFDHLGDVYFKMNQAQKAIENWEKSLRLDSGQGKVKEKLENAKRQLPKT
jgi:tetratricopeptide (TPR) repeat protein